MSAKRKTRKSKRKSKVYIPLSRALFLFVIVLVICTTLLFIVNTSAKNNTSIKETAENLLPAISERFRQSSENQQNGYAELSLLNNNNEPTEVKPSNQAKPSQTATSSSNTVGSKPEKEVKPAKPAQTTHNTNATSTTTHNTNTKPAANSNTNTATTIKPSNTAATTTVKPAPKYDFPKALNNAQLIFIFDDGGQNNAQLKKFLNLPFPITVAVLPRLAHSKEAAQLVRNSGNEVILHQPMQAISTSTNPGPGAIKPDMTEDQIISTLFTNINEIGPVAGMNNHEGSAITADAEKMETILKVASENGIYFLDSRTNVDTKVPYVSRELGYSYFERNIFLDNTKTKENALKELKKGLELANKNGSVIMIGHIWSADFLPEFLAEVYPLLKAQGYKFSVVSKSNARKY